MKKVLISAILAATAAITATSASATSYWVKHGVSLNARSGPSTYYDVVYRFNACTPLHVVSYKDGWAKVQYNHNYYWVSAKYLSDHKCYTPKKKVHKKKVYQNHGYNNY